MKKRDHFICSWREKNSILLFYMQSEEREMVQRNEGSEEEATCSEQNMVRGAADCLRCARKYVCIKATSFMVPNRVSFYSPSSS